MLFLPLLLDPGKVESWLFSYSLSAIDDFTLIELATADTGSYTQYLDRRTILPPFIEKEAAAPFPSFPLLPYTFPYLSDQPYLKLFLDLLLILALCALLASVSYLLSLFINKEAEKASPYECGFAPFDSATRLPFDVHFYLVAILFLIFDVEIACIFPWALQLEEEEWWQVAVLYIFLLILTIGFLYEWRRGALVWATRRQPAHTPRRIAGKRRKRSTSSRRPSHRQLLHCHEFLQSSGEAAP